MNHNGVSFNEEDIIAQNRLKMVQKMGAMNSNKFKKNKELVYNIFHGLKYTSFLYNL